MPQSPTKRTAARSARYDRRSRLLLEVIAVRWMRREMSALVAALHIASEYLPMLIWEPVLGHAGDPARMVESVGGAGSLLGRLRQPRLSTHETREVRGRAGLRGQR